jgi:hypothetical protein
MENVYKENTENVNMPDGPSEFENKRVPMDGIELLLNREKVPDRLGEKMDKKNKDDLSELDDIISDAESMDGRRRRRLRRNKDNFFPPKFAPRPAPRPVPRESQVELEVQPQSPQPPKLEELEEELGESEEEDEEVSEEVSEEEFSEEEPIKTWKSPSQMSRDEITSEKMDLL